MFNMKVQATDVSKRYKLKIKELGRIANPGEVFEVTRDRFVVLNGANQFKSVFVVRYTEPEKEPEKEVKEVSVDIKKITSSSRVKIKSEQEIEELLYKIKSKLKEELENNDIVNLEL